MAHPSRVRPDDDDEPVEEELEEDDEEEEPAPRRRSRSVPRRRGRPRPRPAPVRRWRGPGTEMAGEDEEEPSASARVAGEGKKPVYWRARDSLFFEPLVALAIIVVLLVSLFAYTQNWPPIYVVESNSMQHGPSDQLGLINTGDLVLAQKVALSGITPYVTGLRTGYSTYGEYGDVLLYWPNGQGSTPVIHRAILYLQWDPRGFYNASDLAGLPCGSAPNAVYATGVPPGPITSCNTTHLTGELDLYHIGWNSTNIYVNLGSAALGSHSGFLTMGDKNTIPDQSGAGIAVISSLVEPTWIIGVARGMVPWFGSVKLLLQGQAGEVPPQSWQFLGLTVVGLILAGFGIHYALRTEGIETPLRREEEDEARSEADARAEDSRLRRWFAARFHEHSENDEESEDDDEGPRPRRRTRPPSSTRPPHRGRPSPHVRRTAKPVKKSDPDDDL